MDLLRGEGIEAVGGHDEGAAGAEAGHGLADEPLAAAHLAVTAAQIVAAGVTEYTVHGFILADTPGRLAHDDDELGFIVVADFPGGKLDFGLVRDQGVVELGKEIRILRQLKARGEGVGLVVEAHAEKLSDGVHNIFKYRSFHDGKAFIRGEADNRTAVGAADQVLKRERAAGSRKIDDTPCGLGGEMDPADGFNIGKFHFMSPLNVSFYGRQFSRIHRKVQEEIERNKRKIRTDRIRCGSLHAGDEKFTASLAAAREEERRSKNRKQNAYFLSMFLAK